VCVCERVCERVNNTCSKTCDSVSMRRWGAAAKKAPSDSTCTQGKNPKVGAIVEFWRVFLLSTRIDSASYQERHSLLSIVMISQRCSCAPVDI
jgi:hypothetical protein